MTEQIPYVESLEKRITRPGHQNRAVTWGAAFVSLSRDIGQSDE
jgi:hypothetical protein